MLLPRVIRIPNILVDSKMTGKVHFPLLGCAMHRILCHISLHRAIRGEEDEYR